MNLSNDGQTLRISQLRLDDAGLYTCNAENPLQRIAAATDLRVRDPSEFLSPRHPTFIELDVPLPFSSSPFLASNVQFNHLRQRCS